MKYLSRLTELIKMILYYLTKIKHTIQEVTLKIIVRLGSISLQYEFYTCINNFIKK